MLSEAPEDIGPNVVVVGVGPWGRSVSREAHRLGKLQAFVDPSQESLSAVRTLLSSPANVRSFTNLDEALAVFPDCAYLVCVPPSQHFRVAHQILKAKCHVWIEKPLCTTLADAEELLCMAKRSDKLIFVDHLMRYNRAHEKLIALVRSGWLGEIVRVRAIRQNFGTVRIAENVLWSLGPHDVSLILGIMDDTLPTNVYCEGQDIITKGIEDYINVHMTFPSGAHAHMEISWRHPKKERRLIVYGRRGYAIVNEWRTDVRTPELECAQWSATQKADATGVDLELQPVPADSIINNIWPEAKDLPQSTPLRSALQHFLFACASHSQPSRSQPITDGAEGFRVLRVLVAASNSLKSQAPVQIGDSSSSQPTATLARKRSVIADGVDGEIVASGRASKRSTSRVTATATLSATASTTTTPAGPPPTLPLPTPIAPPVATPVESPQISAATNAKQDGVPGLQETTISRGDIENGRRYFVHETAVVDKGAQVGAGVKIWHFVHVMSGARIGDGTSFGQGCYVGGAAAIGKNVRVQNGVSIYDGVTVEDDAFLGPHCVLSNVRTPRAHISRKYQYEKTVIGKGATVGANATIRCGVRLGDYSFVGAGAVVTKNVPAHALVYGNPARIHGWVSTTGCTLLIVAKVGDEYEILQCPDSKEVYYLYARTGGRDSPHLVRKVSK